MHTRSPSTRYFASSALLRIRTHSRSFTLHNAPPLPLHRKNRSLLRRHPPPLNHPPSPLTRFLFFSAPCFSFHPFLLFAWMHDLSCIPEVARNLAPRDTLSSRTSVARACTRRSSNLLIAIEQLSDGKLSYSCSLGLFPRRAAPFTPLSRAFVLCSPRSLPVGPFRRRAFLRASLFELHHKLN